jgi:hypothetical protein
MRVPEYSAASTTSTPTEIPLMMRLRMGKFCGAANVPRGNSEIKAPPNARICSDKREFSFGYDVDARAKHRDRLAYGGDRTAMAGSVDAARHPTNIDQTLRREVAREALGHARSAGTRDRPSRAT